MISPLMVAVFKCLLVLLAIGLFVVMERNYRLLGAGGDAPGTPTREGYDKLRARLVEGGMAKQLYIDWLTKALGKVDGFFGDARPEGEPPPTWTAPAYDKCLLLALLYPLATIFLFWAISNHIGVAETALRFKDQPEGWKRGLAVASILFFIGAGYNFVTVEEIKANFLWGLAFASAVAFAVASTVAVAFGGAGVSTVVFAVGFAFAIAVTVTGAGAVAVAFFFAVAGAGAFAFAFAGAVTGAVTVAFAVAVAVAFAGAFAASQEAMIRRGRPGVFLALFTAVMTAANIAAAYVLAPLETWDRAGPLLLFFGLLTLLNAPFDWFCLGLTRFLLRRGLAAGGWQPFFYALADAILTTGVVIMLALAMIAGVQAFDELAVLGSGEKLLLPLDVLFFNIKEKPWDPANWWVYALLLSTFIPSLANLMIGGCALMRGFPFLSPFLAKRMPAGAAVPAFERNWMALAMTGQILVGVILGLGVQYLIVWGVFGHILPLIGFEIFDNAGKFVDFDLPGRIIALFTR